MMPSRNFGSGLPSGWPINLDSRVTQDAGMPFASPSATTQVLKLASMSGVLSSRSRHSAPTNSFWLAVVASAWRRASPLICVLIKAETQPILASPNHK